jgi:membrane protein insertase Oxa1/YidC/SpoIIIJ
MPIPTDPFFAASRKQPRYQKMSGLFCLLLPSLAAAAKKQKQKRQRVCIKVFCVLFIYFLAQFTASLVL